MAQLLVSITHNLGNDIMAIKISSKNIFDYKYKIKQDNEITKVEFSQPKLIKKTGAFGDTKTIALIKARTNAGATGVSDGVTYTGVTTYTDIYNTNENPYNGNTTRAERIIPNFMTEYIYKTDVEFDLSSVLLPENFISQVYFLGEMERAGFKTVADWNEVAYGTERYYEKYKLSFAGDYALGIEDVLLENKMLKCKIKLRKGIRLSPPELLNATLSCTIQLYGDYYTVEEEEIERSVGDGKNVFLLNSSELTQNNTLYSNTGRTILQEVAKRILERYENGRETVELLCGIDEYYNTDGTLAISTKDENIAFRCFALGHIVVPYTMTSTGEKPLRTNMEGLAKEYRVIGVSLIFDGGVWQKLTLIEN